MLSIAAAARRLPRVRRSASRHGTVNPGPDFNIAVLMENPAVPPPSALASQISWIHLDAVAKSISVGPNARPYVVQSNGNIWWRAPNSDAQP